ncbi:hypothetical protein SS50377_27304 [Spironucleus salmonicida]|uniref:Uncharacterized protein n=1 Tax=Spironucleus salmonicida TaxID=348837 RepID=A0A9P8RVU7_9EUKA|nr:hypothetical protein SS50377_27304 [Spironucleus salmonicida]
MILQKNRCMILRQKIITYNYHQSFLVQNRMIFLVQNGIFRHFLLEGMAQLKIIKIKLIFIESYYQISCQTSSFNDPEEVAVSLREEASGELLLFPLIPVQTSKCISQISNTQSFENQYSLIIQ